MAQGFIWYELMTADVNVAAAFYKKVVDWDVRDSGMSGSPYLIFGKDGKDVGGIMSWAAAGAADQPPAWMGHIDAPELDTELKSVAADGGSVLKPAQDIPGVGRFAVVTDPQRVTYLLFEPSEQTSRSHLGQTAAGNIGWHELLTDDAATAFDYYAKHYGWQKDYAHDMGPMGVYQTFRIDQPRYSGGMMKRSGPGLPKGIPPHWNFYITVADIDAAAKRIGDAGGKITMPPMPVPGGAHAMQAIDDQGGHFGLTQFAKF